LLKNSGAWLKGIARLRPLRPLLSQQIRRTQMTKRFFSQLLFCSVLTFWLGAQNPDNETQTTQLADTDADQPKSELQIRLGFDSRALVAGRDFNVQQNALMPSIGYYHRSGFFASAAGSLLSDADPKYAQTTLQAGYGCGFGEHFFTSLHYERYLFNPAEAGLLQNAVGLFAAYSIGPLSLGASYTTLFDPEKAQQLNLSLAGYFEKKNLKKLDGLSCSPNASLLVGTQTIAFQRFSDGVFQKGAGFSWRDRLAIPPRDPKNPRNPPGQNETTETFFGPLSFNFGLPLNLQWGRLRANLALQYIVPLPADGAPEELSNTALFSAGIGWVLKG
jgi:hypothetical protein